MTAAHVRLLNAGHRGLRGDGAGVTGPSEGEFHRGILLGLRAHRPEFPTDGPRFHEAYGAMLLEAAETWGVARLLAEDFDPVFGVHRAAEGMVLVGIRDLLLVLLSPRLVVARYQISAPQAAVELEELRDAAVYRKLTATFHRGLRSC